MSLMTFFVLIVMSYDSTAFRFIFLSEPCNSVANGLC